MQNTPHIGTPLAGARCTSERAMKTISGNKLPSPNNDTARTQRWHPANRTIGRVNIQSTLLRVHTSLHGQNPICFIPKHANSKVLFMGLHYYTSGCTSCRLLILPEEKILPENSLYDNPPSFCFY